MSAAAIRRRVLDTYRSVRSIARAAEAAGVSTSWAWHILDEANAIERRMPVYPARLVREAERLYVEEALSLRAVAGRLAEVHRPSPSHEWVRDHLARRGVLRSKRRAQEVRMARETGRELGTLDRLRRLARELRDERSWSVHRISRALGMSRNFTRRALGVEGPMDLSREMKRFYREAESEETRRRRERHLQVLELRVIERATYDRIEAETGYSRPQVYQILKHAGLTGVGIRGSNQPADTRT